MATRGERRRLAVPTVGDMREIAADAYAATTRLGGPIQPAVNLIEPLRAQVAQATDAYVLTRQFDAAVCKFTNDPLLEIISGVRRRFLVAVADRLTQLVTESYQRGSDDGLLEWIRAAGEALGEFRFDVCERLVDPDRLSPVPQELRDEFSAAIRYARRAQWDRVAPMVTRLLAEPGLEPAERALLLAATSEIDLYFKADEHSAGLRAREALTLAPELVRAGEALANWHDYNGRWVDAKRCAREFLELDPGAGQLHVTIGRCAIADADMQEAESRMLEGVRSAPHSDMVYRGLLELYSLPELFPSREGRLQLLAAQIRAIEPDSTYQTQILLGQAYARNEQADRAIEILQDGVDLDESQVGAYIALADVYLERGDTQMARHWLDIAWNAGLQDADLASRYSDVCKADEDRAGALMWGRRAVDMAPGTGFYYHALMAGLHSWMGDDQAARQEAELTVAAAPYDDRAIEMVRQLALDMWRSGDQESVRQIYSAVRESRGVADYHAAIGSIAYGLADYAAAVQEFERAVGAAPENPLWHRQLARALRELERFDEALDHLQAALDIDHDEKLYNADLGSLYNDRGNSAFREAKFNEAISDYERAVQLCENDAVIHSNLALALYRDSRPGNLVANLTVAVQHMQRATELDAGGGREVLLRQYSSELAKVSRFGEHIAEPASRHPITIEFAEDLIPKVDPGQRGGDVIDVRIPRVRASLRDRLGFDVPGFRLRPAALGLHSYRILLFEVVKAAGVAVPDRVCYLAPAVELTEAGMSADELFESVDPVLGGPCSWVDPAVEDRPALDGRPRLTDVDFILRHVEHVIEREAAQFFGLDYAERWIDETASAEPPAAPAHGADANRDARLVAHRTVATARALRAFVLDGVRLDAEILRLIQEELSRAESLSDGWFAAAVDAVAQSRSRANAWRGCLDGRPQVVVPAPFADLIGRDGRLAAYGEHLLLSQLMPEIDNQQRLTIVVDDQTSRSYLRRLVLDHLAGRTGTEVSAVTADELAATEPVSVAAGQKALASQVGQ